MVVVQVGAEFVCRHQCLDAFESCLHGICPHNLGMVFPTVGECTNIVDVDLGVFDIAKQVISLRFAEVGMLFDNIVHVHLSILGIQVGHGKAVWIVPVSAKGLFLLAVYFEGFDHSEIGSHMGNSRLNHSMVPEHYFMLMPLFVRSQHPLLGWT